MLTNALNLAHRLSAFAILLFSAGIQSDSARAIEGDETPRRPNIVVVLADDLGYGDLGCFGDPDLRTPHIDRFAAEGLKYTQCYAAHPNCSPSRAGLMTGRTPFRVGIYNWIPMYSPMHVARSEITIATLLRNSGYDTCHVGKWHLNGDFNLPSQPQPWDHGFNHWFATQNNALPNHKDPHNFVRNGLPAGPLTGYSAQLVAAEAVRWLKEERDASRPFFLFACFHEPHEPIATADEFTGLYPHDDPAYSAHHGNISQLDAGFGRLLNSLEELKLRDDTLVLFTSDNGPAITGYHPYGSTGNLRDKKGAIYEGGIRVPGIARWPGHIPAGAICDQPVSGVDLLPTLCELAGCAVPADRILDGTSIVPSFTAEPVVRQKPLYWQFNRARSRAKVAIRDGQWKLTAALNTPDPAPGGDIAEDEMRLLKTAELTDFQLFDLQADPAEMHDLSATAADQMARMKAQLLSMYAEVREAAPVWPAWEWPRYESSRIVWPSWHRHEAR